MRVKLINKDKVADFIVQHGQVACKCYNTPEKYAKRVGLSVLESGHMSGSRGIYFTFEFEDVPRSLIDQCVRHDVGTFKNVQSFRYVNKTGFTYYKAPIIERNKKANDIYDECMAHIQSSYEKLVQVLGEEGITGEKANQSARGILPLNTNSSFVMGFTAEALFNFMSKRLCVRAEEHVRNLAMLMKEEVISVVPEFEEYMVAQCEKNLWCPEGNHACGAYPTKKELKEMLNK